MEEKMLILKMLQEGKITTEEAVKLLEALEKGSTTTTQSGSKINEFKDDFTSKLNDIKIDEKLNKFGEKASKLAETLGEKAGKLAGQLGENINSEKISNNTEKFTEEFTKRMESLGQDIAESASRFADTFTSQLDGLFEGGYEKYRYTSSYTYPISEGIRVNLRTNNFSIKVSPSDSSEMKINISAGSNIQQLVLDEYFKAITETDSFTLSSEFPGRTRGKIEVLLPAGVDILNLSTDNSKCELFDIKTRLLNCSTSNGRIILTGCQVEELETLTDNEMVILSDVTARIANIRTSNAKISLENCHIDNIDAKTTNAAIVAGTSRKGDSLNSTYAFSTSNGKISISLGTSIGYEHMVNAHTTLGSIDVNLANLTYSVNRKDLGMQSTVDAKSENYDTSSNKIAIKAFTSNAPISIIQV